MRILKENKHKISRLGFRKSAVLILVGASLFQCGKVSFTQQADLYHRHDEYKLLDNIVTSDSGFTSPENRDGWNLVWRDEFNGKALDETAWNYEVNGDGGGNNELQYYTDFKTNTWLKNGYFHIKAIKETYKGMLYTSGRINTKNKQDFTYGRFDIRAKVPTQQGIWPAIWMLPTDYEYGSWPQSGEIDIMESVGHLPNTTYGTLHYGPKWPDNKHTGKEYELENDLADAFHVFSVEWEPNEIRWYIDDVLFSTKTPEDLKPYPWPFDKNFHIILNLAIGGNWPGSPDANTEFPKYMFVDYVRVFKKIEK